MMRRWTCAIIIIVFVLNITACGGVTSGNRAASDGAVSGQSINGQAASGQSINARTVSGKAVNGAAEEGKFEEIELALPLEKQLALIAKKRAVWNMGVENTGEYYEEYFYVDKFLYALKDLDRDGYIEIWTSYTQGTGYFTDYVVYEVNASGTELEEWKIIKDDSVDGKNVSPDLFEYPTDAWFDPDTECYHYTSTDHAKSSAIEGADYMVDMEIRDNVVHEHLITYSTYKYDSEADHMEEKYFDSDGKAVSEKESEILCEKYYESMERGYMFSRSVLIVSKELDAADEEELAWDLEDSWYGFWVEKNKRDTKFEESLSDDIKKQLKTIGERASGLTEYEEDKDTYLEYAVTDFDQDGRLELTVASIQGSGRFTYYDIHEVAENGKKLVKWELNYKQGESRADISTKNEVTAYRDKKDSAIYYLFEDFVRISGDETYHVPVVLKVTDNEVKENADKENDWQGMSQGTATFGWRGGYGYDICRMNPDYFYSELAASWKNFSVKYE